MVTVPEPKFTPPEVYTLYGLQEPVNVPLPGKLSSPAVLFATQSPPLAFTVPPEVIFSCCVLPAANNPDSKLKVGVVVLLLVSVTEIPDEASMFRFPVPVKVPGNALPVT